jgi:regulator of nucleoside diphosphate kinase
MRHEESKMSYRAKTRADRHSSAEDLFIVTRGDMAILRCLKMTEALKRKLETAIVVASEAVPPDVVTMNCRLIYIVDASVERLVTLAYPRDALRIYGGVSVLAPIGAALLGASAGQTLGTESALGQLRVAKVVYQPERSRYCALPIAP